MMASDIHAQCAASEIPAKRNYVLESKHKYLEIAGGGDADDAAAALLNHW